MINEKMGYNEEIPDELIDYIYKQYLKACFTNRGSKWETLFDVRTGNVAGLPDFVTFVVERGQSVSDYKAAADEINNIIYLNVDELSCVFPESAKSSIRHELTHIAQYEKRKRGEREKGEYGFNDARNSGLINPPTKETKERNIWLWMMENLQEDEIEARLTQVYGFVRNNSSDYTPKTGNLNYVVGEILKDEDVNAISKFKDLKTALSITENTLFNNNDMASAFAKDAQAALYGEEKIGNPYKLFEIYRKRFERYKAKLWNAVYQAIA